MSDQPLATGTPELASLTEEQYQRYERVGRIYGFLQHSTKVGDWAITKATSLAGFELIWAGEINGRATRFAYTIRYDELDKDKRIDYVRRTVETILHEWHRKTRA